MNDRTGLVVDEDEFADAIASAFREAARYRERSDDRIVQMARRARGLAAEINDRVFAAALRSILGEVRINSEAGCEVMVLAEQFAHLAGAKSFSRETHSLVSEMRRLAPASQQLDGASESPSLHAAFRARVLALARAIGMSITVQDLKQEELLREHEPMLWLDLATECFAPDVYVRSVWSLLEADALSPFELVRRLPMIVRHQGVSSAQEVLDAACHHLYGRGRYDDAWTLIVRAEDFEPRGWRLPLGGRAVDVSGLGTARDYTKALLFDPLTFSNADAVRIVERFRSHMTPYYALIDDDREGCERREEEQRAREAEEERRMDLRSDIFKKLPSCRDYEKIRMTMVLPEFRHVDASGYDWWQECSLRSIDLSTGKEDFPNVIHSAGKTTDPIDNEVIDTPTQVPPMPALRASSDRLGDDLRSNAAAAGFENLRGRAATNHAEAPAS